MAETTGLVQRLSIGEAFTCVWIGPSPNLTELLFIQIRSSDSDASIAFKRALITVFAETQVTGREVEVQHPDDSAEVTSVRTATCDVDLNPLQLDGMEGTQSIQDLSQSVPLVAGKRTVVRLYLSYFSSPGVTVWGEIALRRAPSDPLVTIPSL